MKRIRNVIITMILCFMAIVVMINLGNTDKRAEGEIVGTSPSEVGETLVGNYTVWKDETITLNGNLTVNATGNLTLNNVTLIMNCTYNGSCNIEAQTGGHLYIYNSSNITQGNQNYGYNFQIQSGATFKMKDSKVSGMGWGHATLWGEHDGLIIRANNTIIENCVITNFPLVGVFYVNSSGHRMSNCTLYNSHHCVQYTNTSNSTLENCVFITPPNLEDSQQLITYGGSYITIANSTFKNTRADALILGHEIETDESHHNLIANCSFDMSRGCSGILIYYSSNNTISNSHIANSSLEYGIGLLGGEWPFAPPGTYYYSDNNTIINCTFKNNSRYALCLEYANNNSIIDCTIEENGVGVLMREPAYNNKIYHNNFINNTDHASDAYTNYWDNGYPDGGNYWDNYTGTDEFSGINQAQPGSDGIGDTPYNISGGSNQDRYPLMQPCYTFTFELKQGWNFITIPLNTTTIRRAEDLAQKINNCTHIARWNISTFSFETHAAGTNDSNFTIDNGMGYLVYVTGAITFTVTGFQINNTTHNLVAGWNSIGRFNVTNINAETLANNIPNCTAVAYWDNYLGRFITHPSETNISNFDIERGKGYMVYVTSGSSWTNS